MQDIGSLGHFHHESGAATGQVIGGADPGKNLIERAQAGAFRGNKATAMGEQCDQRDLPHIGGFTTHIGAGDDEHLPV